MVFSRIKALLRKPQSPHQSDLTPGKAADLPKIYVQIGAGAGDRDSRAGYRDGFSELVKQIPSSEIGKIILVEPNPVNIPKLSECWASYPQASVYELGIVTKSDAGKVLKFYFAAEDAPHYQVASIDPHHVLKHYPHLTRVNLHCVSIPTQDLAAFLDDVVGADRIELLSLDIEGIDAQVLLDTDLASLNVNLISFEHLHLGDQASAVVAHFEQSGYVKVGNGVDHNGFDWLYRRS